MSKAATTAKNKYNAKAYDRIALNVKAGEKEIIKAAAEATGMSLQGFINQAIAEKIERSR